MNILNPSGIQPLPKTARLAALAWLLFWGIICSFVRLR